MATRKELLSWDEVDRLVEHLIPQFRGEFDAMVIITRGGIIPGGMLCERLNIKEVLTAAVNFPFEAEREATKLFAWPEFLQFPEDDLIKGRQILLVDDVWGSGRTITAVKNRIAGAGGYPFTCVLHYNPYRSLFTQAKPDSYAAITDAHIVYPWEDYRGVDKVLLDEPQL
ncbi:MAG: phosphoribosyltransferase [Chloroflexi bacterium]|nr:phosphoribosyltransferase [Chloroflexota bacterium]